MAKMFVWGSVAVAIIGVIILIAIAATPSYYHFKIGDFEQQQGAWQSCIKSASVGGGASHATLSHSHSMSILARRMHVSQTTSCSYCQYAADPTRCFQSCYASSSGGSSYSGGGSGSSGSGYGSTGCQTIDVSGADNDYKNQVQSVRAFLVISILISFAVISLPIIGHFIPSYDGLLTQIAGILSVIAGFCLSISWSIVVAKKPVGLDLFWGFALQIVVTVAYWIIGFLLIMSGMDIKHSQVTKNMAKHQTQAQKQDIHDQLAGAWQTTQKAMPMQQQQQQPQYNPQYGQQTGYAQQPMTPNPVYNHTQGY